MDLALSKIDQGIDRLSAADLENRVSQVEEEHAAVFDKIQKIADYQAPGVKVQAYLRERYKEIMREKVREEIGQQTGHF